MAEPKEKTLDLNEVQGCIAINSDNSKMFNMADVLGLEQL